MGIKAASVRSIFLEAVEHYPPDQRPAYLDRACAGDPALRTEVEILLRAHGEPDGPLDRLDRELAQTADGAAPCDGPGTIIGPYKLMEQIGEGGMGLVFVAEQQQPVRRKVALKVIKPGMDTRQVIARFEAERQALALMDHPNIATVYDGGATPSGRLYFVMELVKGVAITDYCDQIQIPVRERLELFLHVCQAVQHAHQKGIIHRDIKPSNVLVMSNDGTPLVKVIDFGVAKAVGQQLTDKTIYTQFTQLVGTPLYMSPEQAGQSGRDVDTRTDIYALGVLLYELLTGTTPFKKEQFRDAAYDQIRRVIREEEPPKPSTRISTLGQAARTVSADRKSDPKQLRRAIRGELDWIVMKALEKDRNRRYETAGAFAADVQRYLDDEPVQACPTSAVYRLHKFARRNRRWVLAAGLLLAILAAAVIGLAWTNLVISREKQRGDEEARTAKAVKGFLQDLLGQADTGRQPWRREQGRGRNPTITVRELLDRAAQEIESKFTDQPLTEAAIRLTIGDAYRALGRFGEAQQHLKRSVDLRTKNLPANHPDTLASKHSLALVYGDQCRLGQASQLFLDVLEARTSKLGAGHPDTLSTKNALAEVYLNLGKNEEADRVYGEVLKARMATLGPNHLDTVASKHILAGSYKDRGQLAKAEELYQEVLELQQAKLGPDHRETLNTRNSLMWVYLEQDRFVEAERVALEILRVSTATWGEDHPDTLYRKHDLACVYSQRGQFRKAEPLFLEAIRASTAKLGPNHLSTLLFKNDLGIVYQYQGEYARAEEMFQQELQASLSAFGPDHPQTLHATHNLAALHDDQGQYARAEPGYQEAFKGFVAVFGPEHSNTLRAKFNLAILYANQARYAKAEPLFLEILQTQMANLGADHADAQFTKHYLASLYKEMGRLPEAKAMFKEVLKVREGRLDANHPLTLATRNSLAEVYLAQGRYSEADPLLKGVLNARANKLGSDHPDTLTTMHDVASLYCTQRDYCRAEALFLKVLKGRTVKLVAGHPHTMTTKSSLADLYLAQGRHAKAEPLALEAVDGRTASLTAGHPQTIASMEQLVRLYDAWGKKGEANKWRKKLEETKTTVKSPPKL
jgi:serine/threonine protein kinase